MPAHQNFGPRPTRGATKLIIASCLLALAVPLASAQETTTYKEQGKLIRAPRDVGVLGPDLFGDKVNLYTGNLEFVQTDVSLPGNNALPVAVGRRLAAGQLPVDNALFGRWDLEIPHLHGVFAASKGWVTGLGTVPGARCSVFGPPPTVSGSFGSNSTWNGTEYWNGSFLYIPGSGDQEILRRNAGYTQAPTGNPAFTFPLVTRNNWSFRCLTSMAAGNGAAGEAFVAVSPDGTQYQFDWLVARQLPILRKSNSAPVGFSASAPAKDGAIAPPPSPDAIDGNALSRTEVWILPTVVTDRFGNTVTYTYDTTNKWQLKTIVSNDVSGSPRTITLTYQTPGSSASSLVSSVSDGTRTWAYSYDSTTPQTANLATVTQPDGATWQLSGVFPLLADIEYLGEGGCDSPGVLNTVTVTGYMTHPSGARGDFTLTPTSHGRAGVDYQCNFDVTYQTYSPYYPKVFDSYALTKKSLSGPGLPTMAWNTTYSAEASSWAPCSGCNTSALVEVTDPAGDKTRYTFGTLFRETEGQLQQTDVFESSGSLVRSTQLRYAEPVTPFGVSDQRRGDGDFAARVKQTDRKIISQQGVDFTWLASTFNTFAQPTQVTRSSTLGPTRTETTAYNNNVSKWVLGLVASATESSTGKVMVLNSYNSTTANLESITKFGHLEQSMTYNADGTVATRKDGLNHTTTFSNYKRGIPQNVLYANSTTESATVNNIGTIASLTDAAGFATSFGYDTMGRLASITYPSADTVAWNTTTISFYKSASAQFDLPAGHWRQETTTGQAHVVNYYDGLWRPVYTERWDNTNVAGTTRLIKHQYDFAGRASYESYPKRSYAQIGDGIYYEYDALGRPTITSTISELGTLYSGNAYVNGFVKNYTDARGNTTLTSYQVFDEPSENAASNITAPEGVAIVIARDIFGKSKSITRSGGGKSATRSYVYDANERLCKTIEPETGATVQDYDLANSVAWRATGLALPSTVACDTLSVAAASKVTFGYDTLNRLTGTTYGDASPAITRTYTPDGLPLAITSNGSVWTNTYNKRRLNERESLAYGGTTYNLDRVYDANGSLSQLKYPDLSVVAYAPNALGEPTQVGTFASAVTYHPNGAIAGFTYGNGIVHTLDQNTRGLPAWSTDAGVLRDNYTYDANANVTAILDWQLGVSNRESTYDNLDRLKTAYSAPQWGTATFSYDALDNLTDSYFPSGPTARTTTHNYDPTTNRLTSIASAVSAYNLSYGYDTRGNITQRGSQAFVFDMGNRLQGATGKGTYAYDGLGHRVSVVGTDSVNRVQVYSQGGQMLFTRPTTVPVASGTKYIYLHDHVIAESSPAGVQYDHTDGLGSPVAITNSTGAVLSRTRYEPYGLTHSGAVPVIGFAGHVNAPDIGLVYMQQRYYDPVAGRMLSIDPVITDANTGGSFNRYAYAQNNPYRYIDPDGRYSDESNNQSCRDMVGNCSSYGSLTSNASNSESANKTSAQHVFTTMGSVLESGLSIYVLVFTIAVPEVAAAERIAAATAVGTGLIETGMIYRAGSGSAANLTPRLQDVNGLSATNSLTSALPGKNQIIDTSKLKQLCAVCDNAKTGHVSIGPRDASRMQEWIDSRNKQLHEFTQELLNAVIGNVKK
jgi:RHS repeat-associated protein